MPSAKTLQQYLKSNNAKSGINPNFYAKNTLTIPENLRDCLVYVDEMKLVSGIAYNSNNKLIVGISDDDLSWKYTIQDQFNKKRNPILQFMLINLKLNLQDQIYHFLVNFFTHHDQQVL